MSVFRFGLGQNLLSIDLVDFLWRGSKKKVKEGEKDECVRTTDGPNELETTYRRKGRGGTKKIRGVRERPPSPTTYSSRRLPTCMYTPCRCPYCRTLPGTEHRTTKYQYWIGPGQKRVKGGFLFERGVSYKKINGLNYCDVLRRQKNLSRSGRTFDYPEEPLRPESED